MDSYFCFIVYWISWLSDFGCLVSACSDPTFHDNTCHARRCFSEKQLRKIFYSSIVRTQTGESVNKSSDMQTFYIRSASCTLYVHHSIQCLQVISFLKSKHFPYRAVATRLYTRQNITNMILMLAWSHMMWWSQCAEPQFG